MTGAAWTWGMFAVVLGLAGPAAAGSLHCTNTTSGATWDVPVDLAQGTVGGRPAKITDGTISWEDTTLHFYDYDRRTGALDMHAASSTGGFYLMDRCVFH